QLKPYATVEQYLAIERVALQKSEYFNGEMFLMAGASEAHNTISANVVATLWNHFRKRGCRVYGSDMRIYTQTTGLFSYADAVVVCGKPEFYDHEQDILINPTLIVEVLSPATEQYDRGKKFELYKGLVSFQDYVLVAQEKACVEHWEKLGAGEWQRQEVIGVEGVLRIARYELAIPMAEIYLNVEFRK
ncbi:MAG: Uma2 family endonuclease, partial [Chloroherpetonaceae bacterium]